MSTNCVTVRGCLLRAQNHWLLPRMVVFTSAGYHQRCEPGVSLARLPRSPARHVRPVEFVGRRRQRDDAPFRGAADAAFVAHPAHVRPFAHDDGVGLEAADQVIPRRVVVGLVDARIRIRAVEPDFVDRPVFGQQLVKLVQEVTIVVVHHVGVIRETRRRRAALGGIALEARRIGRDDRKHIAAAVAVVARRIFRIRLQLVKVRRRKINGQFDAVRAGGVGHFAHQVALAAAPRTGDGRMRRVAGRPHAESIVVLGRRARSSCRRNSVIAPSHWFASSSVGLKSEGSSRPVPHSTSLNVFTPK